MSTVSFIALLQDGLFAALAGIGFAAISNPPKVAFAYCALIAALGHMCRFSMMNFCGCGIISASLVASLAVGLLAVYFAPRVKCPPETFAYPSLLPMIPGIYAYKCVQAFVLALSANGEDDFTHYFYLAESNGITCAVIVLCMVVGQMIPLMIFKRISYSATR